MSSTARFQAQISERFSATALRSRVQQRIAQVARAKRDGLISQGRFPRQFTTMVNDVPGAAEETIRPGGSIIYRGLALGPAITMALQFLVARSPRRSGRFASSFVVLAGNQGKVPAASFDEARVVGLRRVMIGNTQPYGRKVDVQIAGGRTIRFSVPPGIYSDAAKAVTEKFPELRARRVGHIRALADGQRSGRRRVDYPGLMLELP